MKQIILMRSLKTEPCDLISHFNDNFNFDLPVNADYQVLEGFTSSNSSITIVHNHFDNQYRFDDLDIQKIQDKIFQLNNITPL